MSKLFSLRLNDDDDHDDDEIARTLYGMFVWEINKKKKKLGWNYFFIFIDSISDETRHREKIVKNTKLFPLANEKRTSEEREKAKDWGKIQRDTRRHHQRVKEMRQNFSQFCDLRSQIRKSRFSLSSRYFTSDGCSAWAKHSNSNYFRLVMELKSVWTLVLIFDEHSTMSEKIVEREDSSRVESVKNKHKKIHSIRIHTAINRIVFSGLCNFSSYSDEDEEKAKRRSRNVSRNSTLLWFLDVKQEQNISFQLNFIRQNDIRRARTKRLRPCTIFIIFSFF